MADAKLIEVVARDEMFNILCQMSDRQVDQQVKDRLKTFMGRPNAEIKDELLGLIDDSVYCAWTSDFEIRVMDTIWMGIGGSDQELKERNAKLNDPSMKEEFKQRFKWTAAGH
jgi:hypothetical protein